MMRGRSPSPGAEPDLAAYWDAKFKSLMKKATPPPPPPPPPAPPQPTRVPSPSPSASPSPSSAPSASSSSPPSPPPPPPQQQQQQQHQQLDNPLPKKAVLTAQHQRTIERLSKEVVGSHKELRKESRRAQRAIERLSKEVVGAHKELRSVSRRAQRELERSKKADHPAVRGAVENTTKAEGKAGLASVSGGGIEKKRKKRA